MKKADWSDLLNYKKALELQQQETTATIMSEVVKEKDAQLYDTKSEKIIEKVSGKEKLSIDEQISYLKIKGISFNKTIEEQAEFALSSSSYYYKLTSYRKNFERVDGKYKDLDFAILNDLSIIDMHLRYFLIKLSLDIEHSLKTLLINHITQSDEDGYTIVEEYNESEKQAFYSKIDNNPKILDKEERKKNYTPVHEMIMRKSYDQNDYNYDLLDKRSSRPSIWVLIEMMSYGDLVKFIRFYTNSSKFGSKDLKVANQFLIMSKRIRDASAHSRPIILNIVNNQNSSKVKTISVNMKNYLRSKGIPISKINTYLVNLKLHDLCALLYLHDYYIRGGRMREERKKEMKAILRRSIYKNEMYPKESKLGDIFKIFSKIVRNFE